MTELQAKILSLLKEIDQLCRENDVEYYLVGGSLIGAMRHKGFIPWDDDADIIMTRDNWDRFYERVHDKLPPNRALNTPDDGIASTVSHYVDTQTAEFYRFHIPAPEKSGILIDILIVDPVPDDPEAQREYVRALTTHSDLALLPYQYSLRVDMPIHFSRYLLLSRIFGREKVLEYIDRKAFHYTVEESAYYAQRFASAPHFWPKEIFGKPKYVPFEDTMLPVPERAEDCLCIGYDDEWMFIPRGGPSKSTHEFCVRSLTIPEKYIYDEFERHIDRKKVMATYVKKKKIQMALTEDRNRIRNDADEFASAKIQLSYEKKLPGVDLRAMVEAEDYSALEEFFAEYMEIQCTSRFLGSSSLSGPINWCRKCKPLLIDIGDEALYAVLFLLMHKQKLAWTGKLLKARKALDRPLTEELEEMDGLYGAIKSATSAYDCGEDGQCRAILADWLPRWPENPFLWKLDLKEKIRQGLSGQQLQDALAQGLTLFPEDSELLYLQAEEALRTGDQEHALELFRNLIDTTNHGIVLLRIRETLESIMERDPLNLTVYELWRDLRVATGEEDVPELENLLPNELRETEDSEEAFESDHDSVEEHLDQEDQEADEEHLMPAQQLVSRDFPLTAVQKRRLQLLEELDSLCRKNNITYFLISKGLYQAVRFGQYVDPNADISVCMTSGSYRKFEKAFRKAEYSNRYLDSMKENPMFHRFCIRYCDTESTDFSVNYSGCGEQFGIFITIEILRNPSKSKLEDKVNQALEQGWEANIRPRPSSRRDTLGRMIISILCFIFGRKLVGKWLFNRFLTRPKHYVGDVQFIKPYWKKRVKYPNYLFRYTCDIDFEDIHLQTMRLYADYLKSTYGAKWETKDFPMTIENPFNRIIVAELPSREFLSFLNDKGIDRKEFWRMRRRTEQKMLPAVALDSKTNYYWDLLCLCGERYRLAEKYRPMKLHLLELYRSNRIEELMELLDDYHNTAVVFSKKQMGVCFDPEIFSILEYCLYAIGKVKQAKKLKSLIPEQDWRVLPLPWSVGGSGMRKATENEIPAILVYLKRQVQDCLYMYIDIAKYGLENPNMEVWLDSDKNGVKLVVMKYHTSISVYTDREKWNVEEVAKLIREKQVNSVTARKDIVEKLYELCADRYSVSYGSVHLFTKYRDFGIEDRIELAIPEDTLEIAKLITLDEEIGSYYEVQNLADQLTERMNTGMGRSYVIREDGKIIAHIASYAEFDGIATTSGLIVDPAHRNSVYGAALENHLVKNLLEEGFTVYTFIQDRLRFKLLERMGNHCLGEYGKMALKAEEEESDINE